MTKEAKWNKWLGRIEDHMLPVYGKNQFLYKNETYAKIQRRYSLVNVYLRWELNQWTVLKS